MKLPAHQLVQQLQGSLSPVYVISGDEPLLTGEAADAIRLAARQQGYTERHVLVAETGFDWAQLWEAGSTLSLFAQRRLLELRIPNGKPGDKGAAALLEYLHQRLHPDTLMLITLPRLDGATLKTRWAKALLESPAVQVIQIWPPDAAQWPRWIAQRFRQAGLRVSSEVVDFVATRVEGNLLAAVQEIEKLSLVAEQGHLDLQSVQAAVADSARYTPFDLVDRVLAGQASSALHTLTGLQCEGAEALTILWVLTRELRQLSQIAYLHHQQGVPLEKAFAQIRPPIWEKRRPLLMKALRRLPPDHWAHWLSEAQQIDAQMKGQAAGDPWNSLTRLCLVLAGCPSGLPVV